MEKLCYHSDGRRQACGKMLKGTQWVRHESATKETASAQWKCAVDEWDAWRLHVAEGIAGARPLGSGRRAASLV